MTLKEKINADYIKAFKAKDTLVKNLLSVVKGEIQTIEKNISKADLSDEEVTKILNKSLKSLKETSISTSDAQKLDSVNREIEVINSYLPKLLSIEEIQNKIDALVASGVKNIGLIMKEFSSLPVDNKIVSELARKAIV
jgi:hypothetical protein